MGGLSVPQEADIHCIDSHEANGSDGLPLLFEWVTHSYFDADQMSTTNSGINKD
jgi:hypothetical protein